MLSRGHLRRVYAAVLDEAREAQREGLPFDVDGASWAASQALVWLESTTFDASRMRRLERRFHQPSWHGGYDAAS